jgi:hypothetical protein
MIARRNPRKRAAEHAGSDDEPPRKLYNFVFTKAYLASTAIAVDDRMKKGDLDASKEEVPFFDDADDDEGEGGDDVAVGGEVVDVVGADGE